MLQFKQSMRPTGSHLEHQRPHQHSRAHLVWNRCDCAGVSQRRNRVTGIRCHKATVIVHANCRVKSQNRLETSFPKAHFEGGDWGGLGSAGKANGFSFGTKPDESLLGCRVRNCAGNNTS